MSAIAKGSTVLVTGANGFIASHIINELVIAGYKVRGTVRSEAKGMWVTKFFEEKYGPGKLELVVVPDMGESGAFDDAVKGCSGVIHVATNISFSRNPYEVIPNVLAGITHILSAAAAEPSVTRFVFTSSSTAATTPFPDQEFTIDKTTWNLSSIVKAWAPPPYDEPDRAWNVYGASKTQAEQALWKFVAEKKPHFIVNAILPNANFGTIYAPHEQDASTAGWIGEVYRTGTLPPHLAAIPPQWMVNVDDTARLHVAALVDRDVADERIFAFGEPYRWNQVFALLRELDPEAKIPEDIEDDRRDLSMVSGRARAEEVLRKWSGRGFVGLEESLRQNIGGLKGIAK